MDTWKFLAGLGLFLYGLSLMEAITKRSAGRRFKLFLQKNTQSLSKSIIGGTVITGLIQSSSVIILMLMSFVEAGIISFRNALAVLIGSNLGTTVDSWFIATVGFKFNLQAYSLPIIAVTAITMFFSQRRKQLYDMLSFIFSIGILLLGFGFMKDGAEQLVVRFDIARYADANLLFIILAGFMVTVLIQSSSATMAIALTALNAHALTFPAAACIILGSEVGTTIKILLTSIRASVGSRMLAWSDFIFNIFTVIIAFLFLYPIIHFIKNIVGLHDPLIGLVFFQSFINLLSIILFLPFIHSFSKKIERWFLKSGKKGRVGNDPLIDAASPQVIMQKAGNDILISVLNFNNKIFVAAPQLDAHEFISTLRSFTRKHGTTDIEYDLIKEKEGRYLKFYIDLNSEDLDKQEYKNVNNFLSSMRQSIHAAKSAHDIRHDLKMFLSSANDFLFGQSVLAAGDWQKFYHQYLQLFNEQETSLTSDQLLNLKSISNNQYESHKKEIAAALFKHEIEQLDASTLLNVYQEMFSSKKALLRALALLKLADNENETVDTFL